MSRRILIGTRGSRLALKQTDIVASLLQKKFPRLEVKKKIIKTKGDKILDVALAKIGDKGLFVKELETALLKKDIDIAVHSFKDLPTESPKGLVIAAVPLRGNPFDALLSKNGLKLDNLPEGASVATGSLRRKAQLLSFRPDLSVVDIRGNIETRIKKFLDGELHGLILAAAGLFRLGLERNMQQIIDHNIILPAPAQGAIAVQTRKDSNIEKMVKKINHADTLQAVTEERAFLKTIEGGCQAPISAFCEKIAGKLFLKGKVSNLDGSKVFSAVVQVRPGSKGRAGNALAGELLQMGASKVLEEIRYGEQ